MSLFRKKKHRSATVHDIERERDRLLQGQIASRQIRGLTSIQRLADVEFGAFSQWGEDGILEWIIAQIGDVPESFVEFGVEDYRESNTRFLLQNRNWRGLVIDGSERHVERIQSDPITWRHDLTARAAFIDRDNINQLIRDAGFTGDLGVLSIDIDGNDYWVWEAIDVVNAAIVVVEANSVFGDLAAVSVPYRKDFERTKAHFSNLFFGASPKALSYLAEKKSYQLLGSNLVGSNLFFVHNDYAERIVSEVADRSFQPSRIRESRNADGALSRLSGLKRTEQISDMEVVDVMTGAVAPLKSFSPLFSPQWAQRLSGRTEG